MDKAIPSHEAKKLASARAIDAMENRFSVELMEGVIEVAVDDLRRDIVSQHEDAGAVLKEKWGKVQEMWNECAHVEDDAALLHEIYALVCAVLVHFAKENHTQLYANE